MFKNVAAKFRVFAFDATTNLPKTGDAANITCYVSKDYGTVTVLADTSASEEDATNAKGYYLFDAAQGETNGDVLMVSAKSSTSNIVVIGAPAVIYTRPATGWLAPTTAGRTLDVSAGGEAGVDWANVGSPTTTVDLSGTTIKTTQKVDVDTIKTNPVVNGGTITFPTTATLASTTNITSATGIDVTKWLGGTIPAVNVTGVPLVDAKYLLGTIFSTPTVAGVPNVNAKTWNDLTTVALPLAPTTAGRTLDVAATGEAGLDFTNRLDTTGILPNIAAGAAGGLFIAGSNAATTITGLTTGALSCTTVTASGAVAFQSTFMVTGTTTLATVNTGAITPTSVTVSGNFRVSGSTTFVGTILGTDASNDLRGVLLGPTQVFDNTGTWTGNIVGTLSIVTTYTGNTPQTGDSFARIGATGSGLTSLAPSATALSTANWTNARAGYLDNINNSTIAAASFPTDPADESLIIAATDAIMTRIGAAGAGLTAIGDTRLANLDAAITSRMATYTQPTGFLATAFPAGTVASSAEVTSIQNNTKVVRVVPDDIELPSAGTRTYRIELLLYDEVGNMEAPDSAPTITLVNQAGTDRSSRLDSTTMALVSTGRYRAIYTSTAGDTKEQLVWAFSVVEGGATRIYGNTSWITDAIATDFTAADRTLLTTLATDYTTARAAKIDNLDAAVTTRMATYAQPAGFLAATFPAGTIANTTNIAGGTITTATNLANLPAAAALEATSQSIKAVADHLATAMVLDGPVYQFTANALELAPGGSGSSAWDDVLASHLTVGSTGEALNTVYARVGTGPVAYLGPVDDQGNIRLAQGADYFATEGRSLDWFEGDNPWPTLTGAAIALAVDDGRMVSVGSVIVGTGSSKHVRAEPAAAETASLREGIVEFEVRATLANGHVVPLVGGTCVVSDDEAT